MPDTNTSPDKIPDGATALMRMVDFRIPLPWLLGGFIVAVGMLTNMYFQLQKVSEALYELQVTVRAGNVAANSISGELALLKYRVEILEGPKK